MKRAALTALLSHWRRHPLQLFLLCTGLALATALWTAVQAINSEARASYARAAAQTRAPGLSELSAPAGYIPLQQYSTLVQAGWRLSPVIEGRWRSPAGRVQLIGIEPLTHPPLPAAAGTAEGGRLMQLLSPEGLLLAPLPLAEALDAVPGMPAAAAAPDLPPGTVLTDIATADHLLQRNGALSRLLILPDQPPGLTPIAELAPSLILTRPGNSAAGPEALTASFHLNLTAFGLLSFAVGLFIVHGTVSLAAEQRRGVFRSLRAMGVPQPALAGLLMTELLVLALAGGSAGILAGYLIAQALLPGVSATLAGLFAAPAATGLELRAGWVLAGLAMAVAGTVLAGSQALWRIWTLPVLAAPGVLAWARSDTAASRRLAAGGFALFILGAAALQAGGLLSGFAFLAGLLLGCALCLPLALAQAANLCARRARSPLAEWFWADLRAQLPALSLALMALLLSLATSIGVSAMAGSFRLTFTAWMDQRLPADIYATARSDAQAAELQAWLEARGATVLPVRSAESLYRGAILEIHGVADHISYRRSWPMLTAEGAAWDMIAAGRGVLVNEQFARRQRLGLRDTLEPLPGARYRIAGIYSDYGNPNGQIILSLAELDRHFPGLPATRLAVYAGPGGAEALARDIRAGFDLSPGGLISQHRLKERSLAVFDRTFLITRSLSLLTLGVAGFAILTSLLGLWDRRLPQLAPLWALGVTRRRLALLDLLRSLVLTALTAVLALPLGLALSWVLLKIINAEAFGWSLPLYLFPGDWLRLFLLAQLAAGLAAAIPALRLTRLPAARLLGVFAHER